ncbi:MAG TPA: condensation domain-containing protein, partial [Thermoanaerobaculia bacterium]|nr:condensation domain-containing protein [Thermoanaerobaculia bacterium]
SRRPFDLARGPVLRAALLRLGEEEHRLVVAVHHIAADHWAIAVAVRELSASYRAFAAGEAPALPALPIQYADFAVWQREWLSGEVLAAQLGFWRAALAGAPALLDLPADRPRPAIQGAAGASAWLRLPRPLAAALKALSRQADATLYMLLLAAFITLLHRLTGDEDLVVGSPVAGRGRRETEPLIGFFLNVLPLRGRPAAGLSFRGLLEQTRQAALAAFANQDLPFEKLVAELAPARALSHTPLFQVMLNLQNTPHHAFELGALRLTPVPVEVGATKFDLNLYLEEDGQGLWGHLVYATDLFDASTVARWLCHLEVLLGAVVVNPERRLAELPLLRPAELHQVTTEWNDTAVPRATGLGLHRLLGAQAERTPEAVALTCEGASLSYAELHRRAATVAARLRRVGIGAEHRVGIAMERSLELLPALWGVLEAGAAYLPLDPEYPAERLAAMLDDARPSALLTAAHLLPGLPATPCPAILVEAGVEAGERLPPCPAGTRPDLSDDGQLAYVIYTSGSTGRPKGAMVQHAAIVNRILWMQEAYELDSEDVVLQKTPLSFDVSVWELFWPLAAGARLVLARPGGHRDGAYLTRLIA